MDDQFDPLQKVELAMLRAEHQKRYQVMIDYVKSKVGEGFEYLNSVVRVVVSPRGAYYELTDLPEEFCGAIGPNIERRFVAPTEAIAVLQRAVEAISKISAENTRQFSMLVLYTRRGLVDRKNCFVYEYVAPLNGIAPVPLEIGEFRPDAMPLFFKIKLDSDLAPAVFSLPRGLLFCMANAGDRHLMVSIRYEGEQITDLSDSPFSSTIH